MHENEMRENILLYIEYVMQKNDFPWGNYCFDFFQKYFQNKQTKQQFVIRS